ncbi:MAG: ribosome assembly factor SBDS [Desulfurococcales archaeon]|nr:ribosome assembly factor SBDS [Desulfurococcales archaeon]
MSSRGYVIARYEVKGRRFEILVNPDKALQYREGVRINIDDVLVGDYVYKDVRRGDRASPEELRKVFGTDDIRKVADIIIKRGELQLTTEQRRKLLEAKKKQIINYIARSAVDPQTKTPIPPQRIEKAMEEARVSIDLYKSVEEQATQIVRAIARILPIKIARAYITVKVPPEVAARAYQELRRLGEVKNEKWLNDGSYLVEIELPAGMQAEVIDRINRVTKGTAEVNVKVV